MNREELTLHVKHRGLLRTGFVYMLRALRRLINFDVMVVETAAGGPTGSPLVEPYVTRQITADEYRQGIRLLGEEHERPWAFDREDRCFANLLDSRLVGYQFYANQSTTIRAGLEFGFPDSLTYVYASFTHSDHRGQRLAQSRADARRHADQAQGIEREVVWYVSVDNLAARAANRRIRPRKIGYIGYVRIRGRFFCYASPGCKRAGVSLVSTSS